MRKCKTCAWWDGGGKTEWGECNLAASVNTQFVFPQSKAVAQDFEGHSAGLFTAHDFGCVQWERRVKDADLG